MANSDLRPNESSPEQSLEEIPDDLRRVFAARTPTARANTDLGIAALYLRELESSRNLSPTTLRLYRMIFLRFLRWYREYRQGWPLADFRREDVHAYMDFMRAPPKHWVGKKKRRGAEPHKQFEGPLREAEVQRNNRVIRGFFDYAVEQGRCLVNPYNQSIPKGRTPTESLRDSDKRHITDEMWDALWETVRIQEERAPTDTRRFAQARIVRQRWVLTLLYALALRIDEAANSRFGQFKRRTRNGVTSYVFHVPSEIAKGGQGDHVPAPPELLEAAATYRRFNDIQPEIPREDDTWPLILTLNGGRSITTRQAYNIVIEIARESADRLEDAGDWENAEKMRKMSPHWLRHARATRLLDRDAERRTVRDLMRHKSDSTLDRYAHVDEKRQRTVANLGFDGMDRIIGEDN